MLSNKFIIIVIVGLVLVFGFAIFPVFNAAYRTISVAGLSAEITAVVRLFPYILLGVIAYAGYLVSKRGR